MTENDFEYEMIQRFFLQQLLVKLPLYLLCVHLHEVFHVFVLGPLSRSQRTIADLVYYLVDAKNPIVHFQLLERKKARTK